MRETIHSDIVVQPFHFIDEEIKTQRVPGSLFSGGKKRKDALILVKLSFEIPTLEEVLVRAASSLWLMTVLELALHGQHGPELPTPQDLCSSSEKGE